MASHCEPSRPLERERDAHRRQASRHPRGGGRQRGGDWAHDGAAAGLLARRRRRAARARRHAAGQPRGEVDGRGVEQTSAHLSTLGPLGFAVCVISAHTVWPRVRPTLHSPRDAACLGRITPLGCISPHPAGLTPRAVRPRRCRAPRAPLAATWGATSLRRGGERPREGGSGGSECEEVCAGAGWLGGRGRLLTFVHRALHFECRASSCLPARGDARGCLALAPPHLPCVEKRTLP